MKIPVVIQMRPGENGAAALSMMLGYYRKFVPMEEIREVCVSSRNGSSPQQMADAAEAYGLEAEILTPEMEELIKMKLPVLVSWRRRYWCVLTGERGGIVSIVDPANGEIKMTLEKFTNLYNGTVIKLKKGKDFVPGGRRESLFSLIKGRTKYLRRPMIILMLLTLLSIFLNIGMVKLQKNILDTYLGGVGGETLTTGYIVLGIYLLALAAYFISNLSKTSLVNSSSRDMSALSGSRLFKKMFDQPLKFFEQYSAGELMSRIENNINLDNSIMRSLVPRGIDAVMTVVYLITLMRYNFIMALVCLGIILVDLAITLWVQEENAIASRSMTTSGNVLNTAVLNGMSMIETIKSTGS